MSDTLVDIEDDIGSNHINWNNAIINKFLSKPGEHMLEVGITGSGKTQGLYHILNGILDYNPDETILWISCGKSSEELRLMTFMPCHFLYPINREIDLELYTETYPYTSYQFVSIPDIFTNIQKKKINILCIAPYLPDPEDYSLVISELFRSLIILARDGVVPVPLSIFIDEFQMVAPARGQALNEQHNIGGRWMQRNLDQLRSLKVRIVGAGQSWKRILQGVRTSFGCIMIRQGAEFNSDIPRLMKANDRWQSLGREEMAFAFRTRYYSDTMILPSYGDGSDVGRIEYIDNTKRQRVLNVSMDEYLKRFKRKPKTKSEVFEDD